MDSKPIGIFDSGLGGLSVVKEIIKLLPNENIAYLGDTARVPYGTRSQKIVQKFSCDDADFLLQKDVKCIVIACNTSSAYAGDVLKKKLKIPVFEVITPAVKKSLEISKNKVIGVIGTRGTIASGVYEEKLRKENKNIKVISVSCPLFVPLIEEGEIEGKIIEQVSNKYLSGLRKTKIDTLILGCTHFPIIEKVIKKEINNDVKLVNCGIEVAKELKNYLTNNNMQNNSTKIGKRQYFVTDLTDRFISVGKMFLGSDYFSKIIETNLNE